MKFLLSIFLICFCLTTQAQDTSDVERLREMSYMKIPLANKIDCDSTSGSNLEHRICLNFEFQSIDSLLNQKYSTLLKSIEVDSLKNELVTKHNQWLTKRRDESRAYAEGWRGHVLGIYYLSKMIEITKERIEEINSFLEKK